MKKTLLVFRHEYLRRVRTRGFIFAVVSMPALVFLAIALGIISARMQSNPLPIGYLDRSGALENAVIQKDGAGVILPEIDIINYDDQASGLNALENGIIQAFFILPLDYPASGTIEVLAVEPPGSNAYERMKSLIQSALLAGEPRTNAERMEAGSNFTITSFDGAKEADRHDWFVLLFPFVVGLVFIIVINISGGYLMQSVVDEKENRTMEMIVTSVSPGELMAGKILGNLSVGLTQLAIWIFFLVVGAAGVEYIFGFGTAPVILPVHYALLFGIILPGFILLAALMTLVGITAASLREAQQVSMLFTFPMISPYWFAGAILQHPNHMLSVLTSIFPLTAVVTMPLRIAIGEVPARELAAAIGLMWISALAALSLVSKVFRIGMLRYGKRMTFREVAEVFRNKERDG